MIVRERCVFKGHICRCIGLTKITPDSVTRKLFIRPTYEMGISQKKDRSPNHRTVTSGHVLVSGLRRFPSDLLVDGHCLTYGPCPYFLIHLFCSQSHDRSRASSKANSTQTAIYCFLFQFPVPCIFLKVIQ